ncbi:MAG TPA: hypothetical protein VK498_00245 [Ferruginibacter sp.]|nr:hypothetical protein [Ferruginibacter sp.]
METVKYSEQDIQEYAAGRFGGNLADFEQFIKNNPGVEARVKEYQQLFTLLTTELPSLSFNLGDAVVAAIEQKAFSRESGRARLLTYMGVIISVIAILIAWKYFDFNLGLKIVAGSSLLLISAIIMIIFLGAFHFLETKQVQRKYELYN